MNKRSTFLLANAQSKVFGAGLMPSAQKPAGAESAESALSRGQPAAVDTAVPTPANQGSASAAGAEVISKERQQNPLGNDDLLRRRGRRRALGPGGAGQPFYSGNFSRLGHAYCTVARRRRAPQIRT